MPNKQIQITTSIAAMVVFAIFFIAICFLFGMYFYQQGETNYKLNNITNITTSAAHAANKANTTAVNAANAAKKAASANATHQASQVLVPVYKPGQNNSIDKIVPRN